ncbi:MAG: hypothetical protein JWN34_6245 [Bryobacterales bacterium]|jgi:capsular exopolysaccharide synthesis family protein|nr:hypothetical protein [Bryobacterales bacterium]
MNLTTLVPVAAEMRGADELVTNGPDSLVGIGVTTESPASGQGDSALDLSTLRTVEFGPRSKVKVATLIDPRGAASDRFRLLRMKLRHLSEKTGLRRLLITSALPQDGKTTIALNLATTLAEQGARKVLLIEADLHHPTLSDRLDLEPKPGLAEYLESTPSISGLLKRLTPAQIYLLSSGFAKTNPTELLQSARLTELLAAVNSKFDWIVIDSPPALPLTDALSLARHVDGVLLVARADVTPREAVDEAIQRLGPANILGVLLNGASNVDRLYSRYSRYYNR